MTSGNASITRLTLRLVSLRVDCCCLVAGRSPPVRRLQRIAADWLWRPVCGVPDLSGDWFWLGAGSPVGCLPPRGLSGKLGTEVDEATDEAERFVAFCIDRENEATRELEDTQLAGLGMVRPSPVTRADQGKAPIGILGDVSRSGGVVRDALSGVRVGE